MHTSYVSERMLRRRCRLPGNSRLCLCGLINSRTAIVILHLKAALYSTFPRSGRRIPDMANGSRTIAMILGLNRSGGAVGFSSSQHAYTTCAGPIDTSSLCYACICGELVARTCSSRITLKIVGVRHVAACLTSEVSPVIRSRRPAAVPVLRKTEIQQSAWLLGLQCQSYPRLHQASLILVV